MVKRLNELGTKSAVSSNLLHSVLQLVVIANVVPGSLILYTLIVETIYFSETSVLTKATWCHIIAYGILRKQKKFPIRCVFYYSVFNSERWTESRTLKHATYNMLGLYSINNVHAAVYYSLGTLSFIPFHQTEGRIDLEATTPRTCVSLPSCPPYPQYQLLHL
jgi:hypothetical protein